MVKKKIFLIVVPVYGVVLTKDVNNEFQIINVTLVHSKKLPRIIKRLGSPLKVSELLEKPDFLKTHRTLAVLKQSGEKQKDVLEICLKKIADELDILALSRLIYEGDTGSNIGIHPSVQGIVQNLMINVSVPGAMGTGVSNPYIPDLELSMVWKKFHRQNFFLNLLEIGKNINSNKRIIKKSWAQSIITAAMVSGKARNARQNYLKLLLYWTAIEILLPKRSGKTDDNVRDKIEILFSGIGGNDKLAKETSKHVKDLYNKRNKLVHDGILESIGVEDVGRLEFILFNVFNALITNIMTLNGKEALWDYFEKEQCKKKLGIKSKPLQNWVIGRRKFQINSWKELKKFFMEEKML